MNDPQMEALGQVAAAFNVWLERAVHDITPLIQHLAAYLPKQKIVDRRRLSRRRARRRNARKEQE